jgi:lactate dehydrogenase-like 2-hydroxyacid dehydrogenase
MLGGHTCRPQASTENILVFGLGSIGSIYACILTFSGNRNVYVIARSNYSAVKEHGITLVSPKFGDHQGVRFAGGGYMSLGNLIRALNYSSSVP